ncbi:alpha-hydroxy-acid oxidizing protein [Pigmentiphaga sp. GD03639]|uniref:Alpha-hydroxy-acid oxidizing protein n=1 Tax=Pigmentiphaga daeguensis TaxID=414049 RepID=A0ABN1CWJ6_9BURK|nr:MULTISPECIES: alpha-hydroxy acid oxidase [unclassified Pigmentiphaga]MDH2235980.1 alpha-hydroxy-acid oxidizing protein [Pigmentiphaga sp. GD03639]OVZ62058.1 mandelate dehydrogenase [Pigmentiphaga sp. NML030171]
MSTAVRALARALNAGDLRHLARRRLPRMVFDYLDGGAEEELTLRANRRAFESVFLLPRALRDVGERSQSVRILDQTWSSPVGIAPIGLAGLFWPDGDVAAARAAARAGVPYVLSTASCSTLEAVARAGGNPWFQLYVIERGLADSLVERALAAGYRHLVLTTDVPVSGRRERDLRHGFSLPMRWRARTLWDVATHPRWLMQVARYGVPQLANLASAAAGNAQAQAALLQRRMDAGFDWEALRRLRRRWPHALWLKGILHADDARRACAEGVDGMIVSNHGGRQLDGAPASLEALPAVAQAAGDRPVLLDGGIRRGGDVVKALASGARGVLMGRLPMYGLAAAGEAGVAAALDLVRQDIDRVLALLGCDDVGSLGTPWLAAPPASRL